MLLNEIFKNAPLVTIDQLSCDSRVPMKNCMYFCVKGIRYDGHDFVDEAIKNGANVIVYSDDIDINRNAIFIKVNNVNDVLNQVSSKFYDYPSKKLENYVVSGTNGRSSVSYILKTLISKYKKCASIGTFGIDDGDDNLLYANQATLPILDNQKYFDSFVKNNCKACVLEGKAIYLAYKKLDMVNPKAFIYTHTSFESSDYQELGRDYYDSLKRYLYTLDDKCLVVLNRDDSTYEELSKAAGSFKVSYGKNEEADYQISDIYLFKDSSSFTIKHGHTYKVNTSLLSEANIYNLTAAIVALSENGYPIEDLISYVNNIDLLDGIYERLKFDDFNIYVDCATTADSYNRILDFAKTITNKNNRIFTLVSINSFDSDERLKSIINIVDNKSDNIILTVDDYFEDDGFESLYKGASLVEKCNYILVEDREGALEEAIELLNKGDTLLILGKGNENYVYQGLVKKSYNGDKNNAYKYMNKRLKEESEEYY